MTTDWKALAKRRFDEAAALREALLWAAAALQAVSESAYPVREGDTITIANETRTVAQILDDANAILEGEQLDE